ncbi:molybdenum cofactor guanylyltransferase [Sulfurihydrogenibium subterraneum]|uniref:molybdenum cofactor guanylyltransferase n=1 Tax=Sulfurihydrogenibium subterraneum TaxID=171121 RepID=UPI00048F38F3|nr:molybdenum cofactor guanylyltransferase [Sulfurihydrogenibium subterraneum]
MSKKISCVVLAGGQSKRMGTDKAFLAYKDKTFLQTIVEKLSKKCDEIILSVNKDPRIYIDHLKPHKVKVVKDLHPYEGPLNAILSVSEHIKNPYVFIATCDTPLLNENLIDIYMSIIDEFDAVIPQVHGKFQPLNTLYTKKSLLKVKNLYPEIKSLNQWIKNLKRVLVVNEEVIQNFDPDLLTYKSVNTPEDYERLIKYGL